MKLRRQLPPPVLDALPLGAHRLVALTDEGLYAATSVRIAFTGREGGVSVGAFASLNCAAHVGDDSDAVMRNRQRVLDAAGMPGCPLIVPNQVHGTGFVRVSRPEEAAGAADAETAAVIAEAAERAAAGADGVVVGPAGVGALLNFADCLPLVLVSPSGRFAVAHAGWRGAVAHIAAKAVRELAVCDEFPASCYNAYLGPHIRQECFEVGEDVAGRFLEEFGCAAAVDARHVSLAAAVKADLMGAGIANDRIADAGICTKCHRDRYFSYRATGGDCGRHAAFAIRSGQV